MVNTVLLVMDGCYSNGIYGTSDPQWTLRIYNDLILQINNYDLIWGQIL